MYLGWWETDHTADGLHDCPSLFFSHVSPDGLVVWVELFLPPALKRAFDAIL